MKKLSSKQNILVALGLIFLGAMSRLLPHPPNFTPLAAIGLLGAAYINKKSLALTLPLVILFISDIVINNTIMRAYFTEVEGFILWNEYMIPVYIGFIVIGILGLSIKSNRKLSHLAIVTILASLLFFVITNFGVWAQGIIYPKTISGLIACYVAAIPYFLNSILGNIFFVAILFGAYHLIVQRNEKEVKKIEHHLS